MAIDHDSNASRLLSFFRVKPTRLLYRSIFLIFVGTLFLSWFLLSQFSSAPFFNGPVPPFPFFGGGDDLDDDFEWGFGKGEPNWSARADRVKQSFLPAYHGYEQHAAPRDELLPVTNGSVDK